MLRLYICFLFIIIACPSILQSEEIKILISGRLETVTPGKDDFLLDGASFEHEFAYDTNTLPLSTGQNPDSSVSFFDAEYCFFRFKDRPSGAEDVAETLSTPAVGILNFHSNATLERDLFVTPQGFFSLAGEFSGLRTGPGILFLFPSNNFIAGDGPAFELPVFSLTDIDEILLTDDFIITSASTNELYRATVIDIIYLDRPNGILGDLNCDTIVSLLDIAPFVDAINMGLDLPQADINQDGTVDLLDVGPFIDLLTN